VIVQAIELVSPAGHLAAVAPIEFTLGGRRGVWEREWDLGYLIDNGPVSSAADWFARIAWTAFLEMQDVGSRPRGLRIVDE
jgi:hypothetical protein